MLKLIKNTLFYVGIIMLLTACNDSPKDNGMGEFLPVEKAFVFSVKAGEGDNLIAHWEIEEGYHLYRDKFEFSIEGSDYQISALNMPKGEMILDKVFGEQESYSGSLDVNIALKAVKNSGTATLKTTYQGCSDRGLCYPPQNITSVIEL